jgi:hypothetical protein
MAWTHDTGYPPAYDHTGYAVAVQDDAPLAPPGKRSSAGVPSATAVGAAYAEWDRQIHRVLPELNVCDRAQELGQLNRVSTTCSMPPVSRASYGRRFEPCSAKVSIWSR